MPLSCDWPTRVITVPQSDLTLVEGVKYTLDVSDWWILLRELAGGEEGIAFSAQEGGLCYSNTSPTLGTPRIVNVVNGYTVQFEEGLYNVVFINGNVNIPDVEIKNSVGVSTTNVAGESNLSVEQKLQLEEIYKRLGLDPAAPLVSTVDQITAGPSIDIAVTGDGTNTSTATRQ